MWLTANRPSADRTPHLRRRCRAALAKGRCLRPQADGRPCKWLVSTKPNASAANYPSGPNTVFQGELQMHMPFGLGHEGARSRRPHAPSKLLTMWILQPDGWQILASPFLSKMGFSPKLYLYTHLSRVSHQPSTKTYPEKPIGKKKGNEENPHGFPESQPKTTPRGALLPHQTPLASIARPGLRWTTTQSYRRSRNGRRGADWLRRVQGWIEIENPIPRVRSAVVGFSKRVFFRFRAPTRNWPPPCHHKDLPG